jgi:hypothetical protein
VPQPTMRIVVHQVQHPCRPPFHCGASSESEGCDNGALPTLAVPVCLRFGRFSRLGRCTRHRAATERPATGRSFGRWPFKQVELQVSGFFESGKRLKRLGLGIYGLQRVCACA